jgi:hypothetical protein
MALFSEKDFKDLMIPVMDKDLLKHPLLIQVFGKVSKDEVDIIRYVSLMYDSKSPLRLKIPSIVERKQECAELAGLSGSNSDIFDLTHPNMLRYINTYLRYQSSKVWSVLVANEEVLWQYQNELLTPITAFKTDKDKLQALEIKSKLMAECDAIIKRIDSYEEKLFGDNMDRKDDVLNFTPESIANA